MEEGPIPSTKPIPNYGFSPRATTLATPRPFSLKEIIAWILILLSVAATIILNARAKQQSASQASPQALELLAISRYAVGAHELTNATRGGGGAAAPGGGGALFGGAGDPTEPLLKTVDDRATSAAGRFRAAIVRGELQSKAAAESAADDLANQTPALKTDAATLHAIYDAPEQVSPEQRASFMERYGWYAQLAESTGKPAADPQRAAVINAAIYTFIAMAGSSLLALAATAVGLVLLIVGIVLWARGRLVMRFNRAVPLPPDRSAYALGFAIFLAGVIGFGLIIRYALMPFFPDVPLAVRAATLPLAFLLAIALPFVRGQTWGEWRTLAGIHAGRGFFREIGAGILGYLAGLPVLAVGILATVVLTRLAAADASHPITTWLQEGRGMWIFALVLASFWAPLSEEIMFRGFLFGHLRQRFGWWISAGVMALIFAAIHPQGWTAIPALASIGLVLGGIREWRGSVIGCMTAHALHNTATLIVMIMILS